MAWIFYNGNMRVGDRKVVAISYNLKLQGENGEFEVAETVDSEDPMYFIYGISGLPVQFEKNLQGLSQGDTFNFRLEPENGYGDVDPEAIVNLSRSFFQEDGVSVEDLLVVGNFIPMTNEEGDQFEGLVIEVDDETVTLDFNHPLAGRELDFSGEILEVREATDSELDHGHIHGKGGVHH